MAISRRGTPTGVVDNRGVNNIVLPVTSGSTTGDMMYAFLGNIALAPTTVTAPSGWSKVGEQHNSGTDNTTSYIFQKAAAASEAASYTWTFGQNGKSLGIIVSYSGVDLVAAAQSGVYGWVDPPRQNIGPPVTLTAGDWLATYVFGRQSPATLDVKSWTNATSSDVELVDAYNDDSAATRHGTHALWDSGVAMPAGEALRTVTSNLALQQVHLWALRIPALVTGGGGGTPTAGTWSNAGFLPIR